MAEAEAEEDLAKAVEEGLRNLQLQDASVVRRKHKRETGFQDRETGF